MRYSKTITIALIAVAILCCLPLGKRWYKYLIRAYYVKVYNTHIVYAEDTNFRIRAISDSEAEVEGLNDEKKNEAYIIPSKVIIALKVYDVVSIGKNAFLGSSSVKLILIPNSVNSIGNWAFWGCRRLENIFIPESVTYIGNRAFEYCGKLDVVIENSEEKVDIGEDAFKFCKSVRYTK